MSINKLYINEDLNISTRGNKLATLNDINFYLCVGGILEGIYQIQNGVVDIEVDDEDGFNIAFVENITH